MTPSSFPRSGASNQTRAIQSANIRKIRTWLIEQETPNATVVKMNRRKRRRRESLVAYLPDANAPPEWTGTEN